MLKALFKFLLPVVSEQHSTLGWQTALSYIYKIV